MDEQAQSDGENYPARNQTEHREQPLSHYILRRAQRHQPKREHAYRVRDGNRQSEKYRVPRRATRPDKVGSDHRFSMTG